MNRNQQINWLLENVFQNPTPTNINWDDFLQRLTDTELETITQIFKIEEAGVLTADDLKPFVAIMEKYRKGKTIILEHHSKDVSLFNDGNLN